MRVGLPRQTWRILGLAAVALLAVTVTAIGLISAGFFDPKPVGSLRAEAALERVAVAAGEEGVEWLEEEVTADSYSVRLTAGYQEGDLDTGYGLALGSDESPFIAAVSSLGYVTIINKGEPILPWQPWPHVNGGQEINEIWLGKEGDSVTVFINREILWTGDVSIAGTQVGLWTAAYGEAAAIGFQKLSIFFVER